MLIVQKHAVIVFASYKWNYITDCL